MSTSAKVKFGPASDDNSDYQRLITDLKEWRAINPAPSLFLTPQNFAKLYPRYSGFEADSFRRRYYSAKLKVKGQLFYIIFIIVPFYSYSNQSNLDFRKFK